MSKYSEKLKDPRWQKKRLEIFERDGFTCQSCTDAGSTLHIHHIKYIRGKEPWDYPSNHLITLCHICHEYERENYQPLLNEISKMLKDKLFTTDDLISILDFGGSIIEKKGKRYFLSLLFQEATKDHE